MRLLLLLGAAALAQAQDERDDPALGQDIDAAGVCPTGHQLLWTLSASLREISEAVLGMREQVAALEHDVNGVLGVEGAEAEDPVQVVARVAQRCHASGEEGRAHGGSGVHVRIDEARDGRAAR